VAKPHALDIIWGLVYFSTSWHPLFQQIIRVGFYSYVYVVLVVIRVVESLLNTSTCPKASFHDIGSSKMYHFKYCKAYYYDKTTHDRVELWQLKISPADWQRI
jgi:hypothetical protein